MSYINVHARIKSQQRRYIPKDKKLSDKDNKFSDKDEKLSDNEFPVLTHALVREALVSVNTTKA